MRRKNDIKAANEGALIQASFCFITRCGHVVVFAGFKGTWSPFVTSLICSNATIKLEKLVLELLERSDKSSKLLRRRMRNPHLGYWSRCAE